MLKYGKTKTAVKLQLLEMETQGLLLHIQELTIHLPKNIVWVLVICLNAWDIFIFPLQQSNISGQHCRHLQHSLQEKMFQISGDMNPALVHNIICYLIIPAGRAHGIPCHYVHICSFPL